MSVHRGAGVSASVHAGIPTPPRSRHPLRPGTPPGPGTPPSRHPPGSRHPPEADSPQSRPPQSRHPPEQTLTPSGADPPPESRLQHTVNERLIRILLECILVETFFPKYWPHPVGSKIISFCTLIISGTRGIYR